MIHQCDLCDFTTKNAFFFKRHKIRCRKDHGIVRGRQKVKALLVDAKDTEYNTTQDGTDDTTRDVTQEYVNTLSGAGTVLKEIVDEESKMETDSPSDPAASETTSMIESDSLAAVNISVAPSKAEAAKKRMYQCHKCEFMTRSSRSFLYHQVEAHKINMNIYACEGCEYSSRFRHKVLRHMKAAHGIDISTRQDMQPEYVGNQAPWPVTKPRNTQRKPRPGNKRVIVSKGSFGRKKLMVKFGRPQNGSVAAGTEPVPESSVTPVVISTTVLQQTDQLARVVKEVVLSNGDVMFKCKECTYVNEDKQQVAKHAVSWHVDTKSFTCSHCDYITFERSDFISHRLTHRNEHQFKCDDCTYSTDFRPNYDRHMYNHKGSFPFKCSLCSFGSGSEAVIKRHIGSNHVPIPPPANIPTAPAKKLKLPVPKTASVVNVASHVAPAISIAAAETNLKNSSNPKEQSVLKTPEKVTQYSDIADNPDQASENYLFQLSKAQFLKSDSISMVPRPTLPPPSLENAGLLGREISPQRKLPPNITQYVEKDNGKLVCPICKLKYKRSSDLNRHMKRKHGVKLREYLETYTDGDPIPGLSLSSLGFADEDDDSDENDDAENADNDDSGMMDGEESPQDQSMKTDSDDSPVPAEKLVCKYCNYQAKWMSDLKRHYSVHSIEKRYKCNYCPKKYKYIGDLNVHVRKDHNREPGQVKVVKVATMAKRKMTPAIFKCPCCSYTSAWKSEVDRHSRLHTGEKTFQCANCDYQTHWRGDIRRHVYKHHPAVMSDGVAINDVIIRKKDKYPELLQGNVDCSSQQGLEWPNKLMGSIVPSDADRISREGSPVKMNISRSHEPSPEVNMNDYITKSVSGHSPTPSPIKDLGAGMYKCQYCGFIANAPSKMNSHIATHTNLKRYMCPVCGRRANWKWDIAKHIRRDHNDQVTQVNKLSKEEAEKTIQAYMESNPVVRRDHHLNVTPERILSAESADQYFKCSLCDFSAEKRISVARHMRYMHVSTGEHGNIILVKKSGAEMVVQRTTVQVTAGNKSPGQLSPEKMSPGQLSPGKVLSEQLKNIPGKVLPGQVSPGKVPPEQRTPGKVLPGHVSPGKLPPGKLMPVNVLADQLSPGNVFSGQLIHGKILPGQVSPGTVLPGELTAGKMSPAKLFPVKVTPTKQIQDPKKSLYTAIQPSMKFNHLVENFGPQDAARPFMCSECGKRGATKGDVKKHYHYAHADKEIRIIYLGDGSQSVYSAKSDIGPGTAEKPTVTEQVVQSRSPQLTASPDHSSSVIRPVSRQPKVVGYIKPFVCGMCGRRSNWRWDLNKHIRERHRGQDVGIIELTESEARSTIQDYIRNQLPQLNRVSNSIPKKRNKEPEPAASKMKPSESLSMEPFTEQMNYEQTGIVQTESEIAIPGRGSLFFMGAPVVGQFKQYKCSGCAYRSNYRSDIQRHIPRRHGQKAKVILLDKEIAKETLDSYKYSRCYDHSMYSQPKIRTTDGHNHVAHTTPSGTPSAPLPKQWARLEKKIWKCIVCAYINEDKVDVLKHVGKHNLKAYKCTACDWTSNFRSAVQRHIQSKHPADGLAQCRLSIRLIKEPPGVDQCAKSIMPEGMAPVENNLNQSEMNSAELLPSQMTAITGLQSMNNPQSFMSTALFYCRVCNFNSTWRSCVCRHILKVHRRKDYVAQIVKKIVRTSILPQMSSTPSSASVSPGKVPTNMPPSFVPSPRKKNFHCNICPYRTYKGKMLAFHMTCHKPQPGVKQVKCKYCPYFVSSNRLLSQHLNLHLQDFRSSNPDLVWYPVTPEKMAPPSPLPQSSRSSQAAPKRHRCEKCPYTTNSKNDFLYHKQFHRPKPTADYKCDFCDYWVSHRRLIKQHMKVHDEEAYYSDSVVTPSKSEYSENSFIYDTVEIAGIKQRIIASKITPSISQNPLISPMKIAASCSVGGRRSFLRKDGTYRKIHQCRHCPYMNIRLRNMKLHELMHGKRSATHPLMKCPHCDYYVGSKGLLAHHMKVHQPNYGVDYIGSEKKERRDSKASEDSEVDTSNSITEEKKVDSLLEITRFKKYGCERCPYASSKRSRFQRHVEMHGSKQKCKCDFCDYSVPTMNLLNQHARLHFEPNQNLLAAQSILNLQYLPEIPADVALASMMTNNDSKHPISITHDHIDLYENQSEDLEPKKLYRCDRCPYANIRRDHLLTHLRCHMVKNEYACPYCDYSVGKTHVLVQHVKVHFSPLPEFSEWLAENGNKERMKEVKNKDFKEAMEVVKLFQNEKKVDNKQNCELKDDIKKEEIVENKQCAESGASARSGNVEETKENGPGIEKKPTERVNLEITKINVEVAIHVDQGVKTNEGVRKIEIDGKSTEVIKQNVENNDTAGEEMKEEQMAEDATYVCQYCDREFPTSDCLVRHEMQHLIGNNYEELVKQLLEPSETQHEQSDIIQNEYTDDKTVEQKHGTSSDAKPGTSSGTKPGPSIDAKPGTSSGTKPGPSIDAKPRPSSDAQPGPSSDAKTGTSNVAKPGPSSDAKPGPSIDTKTGPSSVAKTGPSSVAKPGPSSDAQPGPNIDTKPGPSDAKPGPSSDTKRGPSSVAKPRSSSDAQPGPNIDTKPEPSDAKRGPSSDIRTGPNNDAKPGPSSVPKPGANNITQSGISSVTLPGSIDFAMLSKSKNIENYIDDRVEVGMDTENHIDDRVEVGMDTENHIDGRVEVGMDTD